MGWPPLDLPVTKTPTPYVTKTPSDPEPYQLYDLVLKLRLKLWKGFRSEPK